MYKFLVLAGLVMGAGVAQGQIALDEAVARKNLVKHPEPVTPAIAAAAHFSGKVVLLVEVGADGRVKEAKADSGPSMLRPSAVDAVKGWTFRPFLQHGKPVAAHTKLTVVFGGSEVAAAPANAAVGPAPAAEAAAGPPPAAKAAAGPAPAAEAVDTPEQALAKEYFALEGKCHELVAARAEAAAEVKACRSAAETADRFGVGTRFIERRSAYVFAATALMRTDDLKSAIAYGTKAIAVANEGHDDAAGMSAAYTVRAQAEAFAGDLGAADRDLVAAENVERGALKASGENELGKTYRFGLRSLLTFHAQVLTAMKRQREADAKLAEASTL